jgi:hypothetical protein
MPNYDKNKVKSVADDDYDKKKQKEGGKGKKFVKK